MGSVVSAIGYYAFLYIVLPIAFVIAVGAGGDWLTKFRESSGSTSGGGKDIKHTPEGGDSTKDGQQQNSVSQGIFSEISKYKDKLKLGVIGEMKAGIDALRNLDDEKLHRDQTTKDLLAQTKVEAETQQDFLFDVLKQLIFRCDITEYNFSVFSKLLEWKDGAMKKKLREYQYELLMKVLERRRKDHEESTKTDDKNQHALSFVILKDWTDAKMYLTMTLPSCIREEVGIQHLMGKDDEKNRKKSPEGDVKENKRQHEDEDGGNSEGTTGKAEGQGGSISTKRMGGNTSNVSSIHHKKSKTTSTDTKHSSSSSSSGGGKTRSSKLEHGDDEEEDENLEVERQLRITRRVLDQEDMRISNIISSHAEPWNSLGLLSDKKGSEKKGGGEGEEQDTASSPLLSSISEKRKAELTLTHLLEYLQDGDAKRMQILEKNYWEKIRGQERQQQQQQQQDEESSAEVIRETYLETASILHSISKKLRNRIQTPQPQQQYLVTATTTNTGYNSQPSISTSHHEQRQGGGEIKDHLYPDSQHQHRLQQQQQQQQQQMMLEREEREDHVLKRNNHMHQQTAPNPASMARGEDDDNDIVSTSTSLMFSPVIQRQKQHLDAKEGGEEVVGIAPSPAATISSSFHHQQQQQQQQQQHDKDIIDVATTAAAASGGEAVLPAAGKGGGGGFGRSDESLLSSPSLSATAVNALSPTRRNSTDAAIITATNMDHDNSDYEKQRRAVSVSGAAEATKPSSHSPFPTQNPHLHRTKAHYEAKQTAAAAASSMAQSSSPFSLRWCNLQMIMVCST
eukprot:jgi/Bigna1/132169/aug1.16_g6877